MYNGTNDTLTGYSNTAQHIALPKIIHETKKWRTLREPRTLL